MKKLILVIGWLFLAVMMAGNSNLYGLSLGTNLTISDEVYTGTGWYSNREDQEVEPGCAAGQMWDLEGFFMNTSDPAAKKFYMVGGFDFKNGATSGGRTYRSGDIFIGPKGGVTYGPIADGTGYGNGPIDNVFGYTYALRFQFTPTGNTYSLYHISPNTLLSVFYDINQEANPWRIADESLSGVTPDKTGTFNYYTGNDGFIEGAATGGLHNILEFDAAGLPLFGDWVYHFTYGCGNDNLMGDGPLNAPSPVPEPATMFLLGSGMVGLAAAGRKKFRKQAMRP